MHVIFVEPAFPRNQAQFVRALNEIGARVTGIGEPPLEALPEDVRHGLYKYERVGNVTHAPTLLEAVRGVQAREPVDRLEATVEAHVMAAARVREECGIPGTSVRTAHLCRDKPAMKEALRQAGVPCAASIGTDSPDAARRFAAETGYPLIVKPRDAAGAAGTWRVDDDGDLERAIRESGLDGGASVAIEEFVEGHEGFFDTLTVNGEIVHHFISHYYPNVLEAMRTRWISPQLITTNRIGAETYDELRELGRKVIETLDIRTSATHMEWFFGPKGLRFSEIGCRPPGVGAWDLYCVAHDMDVYKEWARILTRGQIGERPSCRFSAGIINLRPDRDGEIVGYEGLEVLDQLGDLVIDRHLPSPGAPTQPVSAGYMANAWVRVKHPDYDELRRILDTLGQRVQVRAR